METSQDEFIRGGGGSPPCTGFASNALPEAIPSQDRRSNTGVSTISARPGTKQTQQEPHWYVIRCAYGRVKVAYEYFLSLGIMSFYPTITRRMVKDGETVVEEENRLTNIFFAYGTFDYLKRYVYDNVHEETRHIRFYYNHYHSGKKEPLIVPEKQIETLRIICTIEAKDVLMEPFVVEKFAKGQHVRVTEGPFAGVEGIVARFQGQQRVGITVEGLMTIVTAYVPSAFLEPLNPGKNYGIEIQ